MVSNILKHFFKSFSQTFVNMLKKTGVVGGSLRRLKKGMDKK